MEIFGVTLLLGVLCIGEGALGIIDLSLEGVEAA